MNINKKQKFFDGLAKKDNRIKSFDLPLAKYIVKHKKVSVLFSKDGITKSFFTEDSKLYLTPDEYRRRKRGERIATIIGRLDSLHSRIFTETRIYSVKQEGLMQLQLKKSYNQFRNYALSLIEDSTQKISVVRMWNLSIVGAVIFGMFTMTMIYRYLGQSVSAKIQEQEKNTQVIQQKEEKISGALITQEINDSIDIDSITSLLAEENKQKNLEEEIREMVKGHPIELMVPEIAKKDRIVAAFIIGIARQESSWGVHVPVYKGNDCYNYWGWRGKNAVGTGGHTCFASPKEAVDTVAKRIAFLVSNEKLNTPEKMIIWKCGDCSWDKKENMQRWVNSVGTYFKKLNTE